MFLDKNYMHDHTKKKEQNHANSTNFVAAEREGM